MEKKIEKKRMIVMIDRNKKVICFTNDSDDPREQREGTFKEVYSALNGKTLRPYSTLGLERHIKKQKKGLKKKAFEKVQKGVEKFLLKEFGYEIDFSKNNPIFQENYDSLRIIKKTLRDCVEENIADFLNNTRFFGEDFEVRSNSWFFIEELKKKVDGDFYDNYKEAVIKYICEGLREKFVTVDGVKYINKYEEQIISKLESRF